MHIEGLSNLYGDYQNMHQRRFDDTIALLERHTPSPPGAGSALLDVGIFPGFIATMAQQRGYSISGIANEEMTPEFRAYADAHAFTLAQCDVEVDRFPFDDATFDVVICTEIIEHMYRNPFALLAQCFRVLKPGGLLILSTPNLARLPVVTALLRGRSYMPAIEGPLDESFPVNPCYAHRREYTMAEIIHVLCAQKKEAYQFTAQERRFSDCWNAGLRQRLHDCPGLRGVLSQPYQWMLQTCCPRLRACLMIAARRPAFSHLIALSQCHDITGCFDVETDAFSPTMDRHPLPAPFRWTTDRATFALPNPQPTKEVALNLRLPLAFLAPPTAPCAALSISIDGHHVLSHGMTPGKAYEVVSIALPRDSCSRERFTVTIETTTWKPADFGVSDQRDLGIMVSCGDALLCSE